MPKFFVVSDVHSFFDEMIDALNKAGFDKDNEEHWLISCGDNWDRGPKPVEVMRYLMMLPRKILVRGNHEQLLEDCCKRGYPQMHDYSNGTVNSIRILGDENEGYTFDECCTRTLARTGAFIGQMVNYFETKNHISVHAWIPMSTYDSLPSYYRRNRSYYPMEDFRKAAQKQWDDAMWLCGPDMAIDGHNNTGKTIVFGHWHCSYLWAVKDGRNDFGEDAKFDPFYGDGFIALDGCTAHSGQVNVVVIEDDFLED